MRNTGTGANPGLGLDTGLKPPGSSLCAGPCPPYPEQNISAPSIPVFAMTAAVSHLIPPCFRKLQRAGERATRSQRGQDPVSADPTLVMPWVGGVLGRVLQPQDSHPLTSLTQRNQV